MVNLNPTLISIVISLLLNPILAAPTQNNQRDLLLLSLNLRSTTTNSTNSTTSTACSPEVLALASGIAANIADQNNEVAAATSLGAMLTENPVDGTLFAAGQASLLNFVQKGIAIRQNNQAIAPAGNPAIDGLAIVANAQIEELNLTMGLGVGGVDVARDNATVTKLLADFRGGIVQNQKNLAASTLNCSVTATKR